MPSERGSTERWLTTALRGNIRTPIPDDAFHLAELHRVDGLVGRHVVASSQVSDAERVPWRDRIQTLAAVDVLRHQELVSLCGDLRQAPVRPLLIKGAGLAYTHYAAAWERPRDDVDIWCNAGEVRAIADVLERRRYRLSPESRPDEMGQSHYIRPDEDYHHQVEVHVRPLTPQVFAEALSYSEAHATAIPVPQLGGALSLGPVHALLLACLHRVAHHFDSPQLLWLYDIYLIGSDLREHEWQQFIRHVERARVRAVVRMSLEEASALFPLDVPDEVRAALRVVAAEPSRIFVTQGIREVDVQWSNLRHAGSWSARTALVQRRLFPPADYLLAKYGVRSHAWLPLLYPWRIVTGLPRWFVRYDSDRS